MQRLGSHRFHADDNIDYQLNRLVSDGDQTLLDEVRAIAPRITDFDAWTSELGRLADAAESAGRAADAARYVRAAAFFVPPGDARLRGMYRRFKRLVDPLLGAGSVRHEVVWRDARLPVIEIPAHAAATTLVVHGGFDSYLEEFVPLLLAISGGSVRVIAFEGPGQGHVLIEQGVAMTPEWEGPTSAVIDAFELDDVTLIGISLGGCLALRAAAREPRIARVVAYDVMYDFFDCVASRRGPGLRTMIELMLRFGADRPLDLAARLLMRRDPLARWGIRQGMAVTGVRSPSAFLRETLRYTTRDISANVTQDVLLLAGSADHFVPLAQLGDQRAALTNARSVETRLFTPSDDGQSHCQVGNLPLVVSTIRDFIDRKQRLPPSSARD